jgi:ABC-2 type transport system permease protein
MIWAILRAQWLSMRTLRVGTRVRSAIFSTITGLLFYGFWAFIAFGAEAFFANPESVHLFKVALPMSLAVVVLYWQVAPVVSASMGASLDLKKLVVYPIPRERLFAVEILLRLTTCMEMLLGVAGILSGLLRNPRVGGLGAVPRMAATGLLFIAFNLLLAAGMRNLLERLLLRRRLREILMLVIVFVGVLPQLLISFRVTNESLTSNLPVAMFWPWGAATDILLGNSVWQSAAILLGYLALAYGFSRYQFEKTIRADAGPGVAERTDAGKQAGSSWSDQLVRLPSRLLKDPLGAAVEKELRTLTRSPRFRLVYIMGFSFGLAVWLPMALRFHAGRESITRTHFLTYVSVYALVLLGQVTFWNAFGFDRTATQAWYALPIPFARVFQAKNISALIFVITELILVIGIALVLPVPHPPARVAEAIAVTLISAVYLIAFGNLVSVRLPRAMDPEKVTQGGSARSMNAFAFFLFPVALMPIALAYWARYVFDSEVVFFALLTLAAGLGVAVYWIALESAVKTALLHKESILDELGRSDGPLSVS